MKTFLLYLIGFSLGLAQSHPLVITSPSKNISVTIDFTKEGEPLYSVLFNKRQVIAPSKMGFLLKNGSMKNFALTGTKERANDDMWKPVWGEVAEIRDYYNEGIIMLEESTTRRPMNIVFRVFDDGIGFRYEFPSADSTSSTIEIAEELTQFRLTQDLTAFWIPGD